MSNETHEAFGRIDKALNLASELLAVLSTRGDCGEASSGVTNRFPIPTLSDQHLLDEGWIRHTGAICPVHELDEGRALLRDGVVGFLHSITNWGKSKDSSREVTHYKITKAYDPHAESKALYAKEVMKHKEPWKLWEFNNKCGFAGWLQLKEPAEWSSTCEYRRKQTKKLVYWSCPLLKGANTNYGELYTLHAQKNFALLSGASNAFIGLEQLRLLPPSNDKSNWQAYNGEDLGTLHEAGFVVEVKWYGNGVSRYVTTTLKSNGWHIVSHKDIAAYRVIAIRDGFTANPEEVV